jgi:hypothetical protein
MKYDSDKKTAKYIGDGNQTSGPTEYKPKRECAAEQARKEFSPKNASASISASYYRKKTASITKEEIYTTDWERTLITDNETEGNRSDIKLADKYYTRI